MSPAGTWALVPLRQLGGGKERLSGALDAVSRRELVVAMAEDVLRALLAVPLPGERILLVSEDPQAGAFAERLGVRVYRPAPAAADPLNAALAEAAGAALREGADTVLMIHADLPLAGPAPLRALLAAHAGEPVPATTLVPDREGTGTNCLLQSPPGAGALRFGPGSRARHRAACAEAGVQYREFTDPALGFDVDLPEDLARLVRPGQTPDNACGARTRAWLEARRAP